MTYDEFEKKYLGKAVDFDGKAGVQCVDLADRYFMDVIGIKMSEMPWVSGAREFYTSFSKHPALVKNFDKIPNTRDLVCKKGDVVIWNGGKWGHVAIATGEGDVKTFTCIEQNTLGRHEPVQKIKHTFNSKAGVNSCWPVAGVLRPKDQTKVNGAPVSFAKGTYTLAADMKVRTGAGTSYAQKKTADLTADGKKHALPGALAVLKAGTKVTVSQVKKLSATEFWGKIPSGWVCLMLGGKRYVVK